MKTKGDGTEGELRGEKGEGEKGCREGSNSGIKVNSNA